MVPRVAVSQKQLASRCLAWHVPIQRLTDHIVAGGCGARK